MGPAGSGKTTVGRAVATRLGWSFVEGDDFHSKAAVRKMASGVPLDDADRAPWLKRLNALLKTRTAGGESLVLACSALKERYRETLAAGLGERLAIVYLKVSRRALARRLASRRGHFFGASLLDSQLATLEEPKGAITVKADHPLDKNVRDIVRRLAPKPLLPSKKSPSSVPSSRWIDVSVPLRTGMVHWPGDPGATVEKVQDLERGDPVTLSFLSMGAHTGTHMDAPSHFVKGAPDLDSFAADAAIGPARVVAVASRDAIMVEDVRALRVRPGERILFKTRNSSRCWKSDAFVPDFVHLSPPAARELAARGARLVGVDYLSVGAYQGDGRETHEALLGAGVWILEGLDLSRVPAGPVDLVCLPLRLAGADGAPARAFVRPHGRHA
jgi:arylformamidase